MSMQQSPFDRNYLKRYRLVKQPTGIQQDLPMILSQSIVLKELPVIALIHG